MDGLAVFGLFSFVFSLGLYSRVKRLERILRENGIRPKGAMARAAPAGDWLDPLFDPGRYGNRRQCALLQDSGCGRGMGPVASG